MESDGLYTGPSVLAPEPRDPLRGDRIARMLLWPLMGLLFVTVLVFYVLFSAMQVDGESMYPGLHDGDRLLHTKSYDTPIRGDVVIISRVDPQKGPEQIVKRIVGIAGDVVEIRQDVAYVNGKAEDTADRYIVPAAGLTFAPVRIPAGYVYVLGDNRPVSLDSRFFGLVPDSAIQGKAVFVFSPVTRVRRIR